MIARRSLLAIIGGGLVAAAMTSHANAGPAFAGATPVADGPAADPARNVADLRRGLAGARSGNGPREMQYYIVRRRYYVRRYYVRPRRLAVRCWWNGYGRVCRYF
ncbi:hypothetical protein [Phreatobacter stygius]|uniref:Protamine-2 (Modular protein) n=1 Tax=Phreatobacter stygius TaxID=1940610 RepID=A0A4D7B3Z0_9HYPH|nr:hypothetical protein [Phreatobacter stygius]QCI67621.1 hypothetical protein E8M01_27380 [Phreatobacter stygius]